MINYKIRIKLAFYMRTYMSGLKYIYMYICDIDLL